MNNKLKFYNILKDTCNTIDEMVTYADGESVVDKGTIREGVVLRTSDGVRSFKAVSNAYLIEKGE